MQVQCTKYPLLKGTLKAKQQHPLNTYSQKIHIATAGFLQKFHGQFPLSGKIQQMISWLFFVNLGVNLCLEVKLHFPQDFIIAVTTGLKF